MKAICKYCWVEFEAKRNTAMFCTDSHRVMFNNLTGKEKEARESDFLKVKKSVLLSDNNLKLKVASEITPQPIIDNECRQVKDYCKETGLSVDDVIQFHRNAQKVNAEKPKTIAQKREEERSSQSTESSMPEFKSKSDQLKWLRSTQKSGPH